MGPLTHQGYAVATPCDESNQQESIIVADATALFEYVPDSESKGQRSGI